MHLHNLFLDWGLVVGTNVRLFRWTLLEIITDKAHPHPNYLFVIPLALFFTPSAR